MKSSTILKYALVRRGHQNFLGGRLFSTLIQLTPSPMRRWAALRIVGLSPHYFYGPADREHNRLTTSRRGLISDLVAPLCSPESVALDYGCGPGYAAKAVSAKVRKVWAIDLSEGALAAARVINGSPNIEYLSVARLTEIPNETIDVVYSFAVLQHVGDEAFAQIVALLFKLLKPGGKVLLHVVIDGAGWRSEREWRDDASLRGKLRLRHGLNCFSRSRSAVEALIKSGGFQVDQIVEAAGKTIADADIASQHLVYASKA